MKPLQPTLLCLYRYDALDRLIGHTPLDEPPLQRFYCKSRLTTEVQGVIKHSVVQQGDLLLAQQRGEGDAFEISLLATDQQRSVMQTLKDDHPSQLLAYSPYGHRPVQHRMLSLLGFNGERPESVTGHYLLGNGYRAFNPVLMRFNSPDSLSPFGKGGLNSYMYCLGDPVNWNDQSGHIPGAVLFKYMIYRATALADRAQDAQAISFARSLGSSNNLKAIAKHSFNHTPAPLAPLATKKTVNGVTSPNNIPTLSKSPISPQITESPKLPTYQPKTLEQLSLRAAANYEYPVEQLGQLPRRIASNIRDERTSSKFSFDMILNTMNVMGEQTRRHMGGGF